MSPTNRPDGPDVFMNTFVDAARNSRNEVMQAWSRGCEMYARYFSNLAKATGPEGLLAANADFFAKEVEVLTKTFAFAPKGDGKDQPGAR